MKNLKIFLEFVKLIQENNFQELTNLQYLIIWDGSGDLIPQFSEGFKNLSKLKYIDLSYNKLKEVPENLINGLPSLEFVLMFDNQLTYIPEHFFDNLPSLQKVYLGNNNINNKSELQSRYPKVSFYF